MEEKECLECGTAIFGRADKKFCSDQCRNSYNNKLNSDSNNQVRNINNILRKNRRILMELNPNGKTKAPKSRLLEKGFDFNHITSIYTTKAGATYHFCYEYGYLPLDNDWFALVIKN
ncbi:DUF2116 family Zn-ribbon domain-containing protein [Fulvivirga sp. RKSG066]|uniref:DUF2116 family Zn-ribbon domain-containing protein n=1 Tax=Fulvivirga aurantia TaxID=2529383 RepID=UPI0012BC683A|nr:DUF2116 family Zn-ribbon domain-containing protein [Fulvivirga aurantia]MTI22821.1 DUF2116 family Zn-ribbon domain-containing protein [Fulvivirga aurantia]